MQKQIVRRVPDFAVWSGLMDLQGPAALPAFLQTLLVPMVVCDIVEQGKPHTVEAVEKPRTWCAVGLADSLGRPIRTLYCGRPLFEEHPDELARVQRSSGLVVEKNWRGAEMHRLRGDITASQSADESANPPKYGGALRIGHRAVGATWVAISGLPGGFMDEAAILLAAVNSGVMTLGSALSIASDTGNPAWRQLVEAMDDEEVVSQLGSYRPDRMIAAAVSILRGQL